MLSDDLSSFIIIGFCLIISAFFSASETAITSLGALKARHLIDQRGRAVKQLRLWLQHPSRVLTTILIFNNLVNILASALAAQLASKYFENQAISIATGTITFLVLIFGEIIPKSFARANSEKLSIFCMLIISVIYRLFFPIVWAFSELANHVIRWLGSDQSLQPAITEEELEFLIEVGEKAGVLEDMKRTMISGVFEFDETKVREVMTPRTDIVAVEKNDSIEDAVKLILQTGHTRLPVYEERVDNIIGLVFAKDLLRHLADPNRLQNGPENLSQVMREPMFVPESKPLMEFFKELKRTKNHMAIIIDEYGGTAGIVTMEDILEEIVGDIQDEYDVEEASILKIDDGVYDVAGSVNISEFVEYFDLDDSFEKEVEGEVDTIAGWMTQLLGHLPEVGQTLTHGPLTIEVTDVERHRIDRLRVIVRQVQPETASQPAT
ncbi:MAG: hemolysin family protein [Oligoflexus sp.]